MPGNKDHEVSRVVRDHEVNRAYRASQECRVIEATRDHEARMVSKVSLATLAIGVFAVSWAFKVHKDPRGLLARLATEACEVNEDLKELGYETHQPLIWGLGLGSQQLKYP